MYFQWLLGDRFNITVGTVALILATIYFLKGRKGRLRIPGPSGIPFLGNFYQIRSAINPLLKLDEWSKVHGPVYVMRIFNQNRIVVSGYNELTEMLITKGKAFAGRPSTYRIKLVFKHKDLGFNNASYPQWMPLRKAGHRAIHHYGDGMTQLETAINTMAEEFVTSIKSYDGKQIDLRDNVYDFVVRIAATMLCGKHLNKSDEIVALMKHVDELSHSSFSPTVRMEFDLFPWLRHFGHPIYQKIAELKNTLKTLWLKMKEAGIDSYDPKGDAKCAVHSLLQLQDQLSPYHNATIDDEHIRGLFTDLIFASIVTTSSYSYALPNILLHYVDAQKKLREEVDRVIGHNRLPNIRDRDAMPYACATIFELLRYASNLVTVLHETEEDTSVGGYHIPAGTIVSPLYWSLHHDEKFWNDPWVFRPERFLDENGSLLPNDHPHRKHLMAFGAGTRSCIGEVFALKRLFVFATSLVQSFELLPGDVVTSCDSRTYSFSSVLRPTTYSIRLIPRSVGNNDLFKA